MQKTKFRRGERWMVMCDVEQERQQGELALTCIHGCIHCGATRDADGGKNELCRIEIDIFLETLAEIAMTIANRTEEREA